MRPLVRWLGKLFVLMLILYVPLTGLAKEIKPGITINKDNYKQYLPELKRLLDPATYIDIVKALEKGIYSMPITKTHIFPLHKQLHEASQKYSGTSRVGPNNELIGWKVGMPFPNPKTGAELCWNLDRRDMGGNQTFFRSDFMLSKNGKLERSFKWNYYHYYYTGRFNPPVPEVPGNNGVVRMKESFIVKKPFDVKGFCFIRTRYEDLFKTDDVFSYIPAIRRVRRLTGADVCDPILGSDLIYDDFEFMRQKITPKMTFKMRVQEMLVPSQIPYQPWPPKSWPPEKWPEHKMYYLVEMPWEIRPCYVLEVYINDPEYLYSKRVIYMEKQRLVGVGYYLNTYDQKGRLHRSEIYWNTFEMAPTYYHNQFGISCANHLADHRTFLNSVFLQNYQGIRPKDFSFRWLLRQVK